MKDVYKNLHKRPHHCVDHRHHPRPTMDETLTSSQTPETC